MGPRVVRHIRHRKPNGSPYRQSAKVTVQRFEAVDQFKVSISACDRRLRRPRSPASHMFMSAFSECYDSRISIDLTSACVFEQYN